MAQYDVFLSHASEDKKSFVDELNDELNRANYRVWYDKTELYWGDELERTINKGLAASKYGIVVISNNYLAKHKIWTKMEYSKILEKDKILPILHNITLDEIKNEHPQEYVKIQKWRAISSDLGIKNIVQEAKKKIDNLKSERNIDYITLRDLLAAEKWKQADQETLAIIMLIATGRKAEGTFSYESIENFPCTDLSTIDRLWAKYSEGRFGLVKKEIVGRQSLGISEFCSSEWERACSKFHKPGVSGWLDRRSSKERLFDFLFMLTKRRHDCNALFVRDTYGLG